MHRPLSAHRLDGTPHETPKVVAPLTTLRTRTGSERVSLSDDYRVAFDNVMPAFVVWKRVGSDFRDVEGGAFDTRDDLEDFLDEHELPTEGLDVLADTALRQFQEWDRQQGKD